MVSRLVSLPILPAQFIGTRFGKYVSESFTKEAVENSRNYLTNNLNYEEVTIPTKDRVKLNGMLFKKQIENDNRSRISKFFLKLFNINEIFQKSKVWINFNGNGMCYEFLNPKQIKKIQKLGFDFLAFNYRSVVKSEGKPTQKGLIEDGKTVIKYANTLGYDDLYIHGHSLGGAISTKAVAQLKDESPIIYKKVKLIVDRTFSSIKAVLKTFNIFRLIKWIVIKILNFSNWNIKVKKDWEKIDIEKCLFYAPNDEMIKEKSALFRKVKNTTDKNKLVELENYEHRNNLTIDDMKKAISIVG